MNFRNTLEEVIALFSVFGLQKDYILPLLRKGSSGVEELKQEVKGRWKKLAFSAHPDRGGNNEMFSTLNNCYQQIKNLQFDPKWFCIKVIFVRVNPYSVGVHPYRAYNQTTATTTSYYNKNTIY